MKGSIEAESVIVGVTQNSGIAEWSGRWSYECSDGCDCLGREAVVEFVAIGAQRVRIRGEGCESDTGMKRNHDMMKQTQGNAKIVGILECERSRISSRYSVHYLPAGYELGELFQNPQQTHNVPTHYW